MRKSKSLMFFLIATIIAITCSLSMAQNTGLYIPLNIKKSIDKGVRSIDGKPGPNYWINHSEYNINAELFPEKSTLSGTENLTSSN